MTDNESKQYRLLLKSIRRIVKHQEEKEKLRGESFNIFSILKMESKENGTHSAFLAELLNPKGSHHKKEVFLKLFLETLEIDCIDLASARVKVEHSIGKRNDDQKQGGRIDIYIRDESGNSISIENKIYAGDQFAQIERYCNHNKGCNRVYYLTLWGGEPSLESRGNLQSGTDFWNISYKKHLANWLEKCLKESAEQPILRESIKQYLLLIRKLTHSMDDSQEKELFGLIIENYEEAAYLVANFHKALSSFNDGFRKELMSRLKKRLESEYDISLGSAPDAAYSQIWIRIKGEVPNKLFFGIQSFSAKGSEPYPLFVGIFVFDGKYDEAYHVLGEKRSNWWTGIQKFSQVQNITIDFSDSAFLRKLYANAAFQEEVLEKIVSETLQYLETHKEAVLRFLKRPEADPGS